MKQAADNRIREIALELRKLDLDEMVEARAREERRRELQLEIISLTTGPIVV